MQTLAVALPANGNGALLDTFIVLTTAALA
jgi:hypothetical protein